MNTMKHYEKKVFLEYTLATINDTLLFNIFETSICQNSIGVFSYNAWWG